MSTSSGSSQGGVPGPDVEANETSLIPGSSMDFTGSSSDSLDAGTTCMATDTTALADELTTRPSAGSSISKQHESTDGLNPLEPTAQPFKEKNNDPFMKSSSKRKQKKAQGSSKYKMTSDAELQQSPLMEETNQNEEELDFEEEEYESLEEGEEESDRDEGVQNQMEWSGDRKESDVKDVKEKSRKKDDEDEDEDGEVNSDDDLEEGEVKEDDDSETGGGDEEANGQKKITKKTVQTTNTSNQAKTSICRFFAKGQCTWGLNCRFLHLAAPVVALPLKLPNQRGFPYQVGLNPTGLHPAVMHPPGAHPTGSHPTGPHGVTHTTGVHPTGPHSTGHHPIPRPPLNRHQAAALAGTTIHPPHPQSSSQSSSSNTDIAWVRGLRNAKEMLVKANKRKEEESDFEKRFNTNAEEEGTSKHSHHSRESPEPGDYVDRRSPHNYHGREREKRSHREVNRRDYNREGREPRDTREREPRDIRERDNTESQPREEYWNSEYERRRRLAFESAPWNDEQSPPPAPSRSSVRPQREAAEMYRDPWRRSKSPPAKWSGGRRADVSTASKRSHSMSSISDSESASGLSGTGSGSASESFTGSEVSYSEASQVSGRSPHEERQKTKSKSSSRDVKEGHKSRHKATAEPSTHHTSVRERGQASKSGLVREKMSSIQATKSRSNRSSLDEEASGSVPLRKKPVPASPPPQVSKPRRDSWSDSDTGSMSQTDSSVYSNSETGESEPFSGTSDTPLEDDRRSKDYRNRRDVRAHPSSTRQAYDSSRRGPQQRARTSDSPPPPPPPPSSSSSHHASNAKRMKMTSASTSSSSRENNPMKNRHSSMVNDLTTSNPQQQMSKKSLHTPNSPKDGPKKNPIKMTFKKKHSNLKTDRFITAKLSGGKSDEESGEEEESEPFSGNRRQQGSPSADVDADDIEEDEEYVKEERTSFENASSDRLTNYHSNQSDNDNIFNDNDYDDEHEHEHDQSHHRQPTDKKRQQRSNTEREKNSNSKNSPSTSHESKRSSRTSDPSTSSNNSSKTSTPLNDGSSRREHLLKQLEAVEAMIAKKRAKLQ